MAARTANETEVSEVIRSGESYSKGEFMRRTRMSKHAFATAKRNGLSTRYVGNRLYINGSDWLDYVASRPVGVR